MADNIRTAPSLNGADPNVATDDIAGVHYQKIKAGWGADGVWNETTDADGLRVPVGGALIGLATETAPASDTASSGLNGRLQRIAQRLTALLPATLGQKTMAASLAVTLASDQPALPTAESKVGALNTRAQVTIPNTATTIAAAFAARRSLMMKNIGSVTVYVGSATVTTSNGTPLLPGESFEDRDTTILWQGITATGTSILSVLEA